jgi:hypothetical protein
VRKILQNIDAQKGHRGQHRIQENFLTAQHLGLDFDTVSDIDAIFSDPFIR